MDPIRLIVNADDFGYFNCVSRGILESIGSGAVTATGIMANGPSLEKNLRLLQESDASVDLGVHLNLSLGSPLTPDMRQCLMRWHGKFPGKFALAAAVLTGRIRPEAVKVEWIAQIERCLDLGVELLFLNSHEHVHMLPALNSVYQDLAATYRIPFVRHVTAEPGRAASPSGVVRNLVLSVLSRAGTRPSGNPPCLLGLGASGKLSQDYLQSRLRSLRKGQVYELMCHPGYYDSSEIKERRLIDYHDWESELRLFTSPSFQTELGGHGVRLVGYRDLLI